MRRLNYGIYGLLPLLIFVSVFVTKTQIVWAQATPASFTTQGNGVSWVPILNRDGGFVAFSSFSSNFVPDDTNNLFDLFFYDRTSKIFSRVNVSSNGEQSNGSTGYGFGTPSPRVISDDGRFVAFEGILSAPTDNTGLPHDIFVRDRQTEETARLGVALDGTEASWSASQPSLSADGRFVAFSSSATNLVPDDTNGSPGFSSDVFVRNLQTGTTERVSIGPNGEQGNGDSDTPSISADGRYVAFSSVSTNWHSDSARSHIYVRDRITQTTERISPLVAFFDAGNFTSPIISADGRYVVFQKGADELLVHDRQLDTTTVANIAPDGTEATINPSLQSLSDDGRFLLFFAWDSIGGASHLFVRDLITDVTAQVSSAPGFATSGTGSMSGDGKIIAFGPPDASPQNNSRTDIYVTDNPLFESTSSSATLTVIKQVMNNNGGTKVASDFTIAVSGTNVSPATFGGSESGTVVSMAQGTYSVSETLVAGYTGSFGVDCSGTIASGEAKTCVITNTHISSGNHAPTLSTLLQWDGSTSLSEGWILPSPRAISFSANVSDPDGDQVKLQVELRRFEEPFTGIDDGGILTSDPVPSGSENVRVTRFGLSDGKYHWRG